MITIDTFELPPVQTNAYLVTNTDTRKAFLVDAPHGAASRIAQRLTARQATLEAVLLTHGHFDHVMDTAVFNQQGVPVFGHRADEHLFDDVQKQIDYFQKRMGYFHSPAPAGVCRVDRWLQHGQQMDIAGLTVSIRLAPGHSHGSLVFVLENERAAFVGDVIMAGAVGRYDFPGGSQASLERSIREQIYTLPAHTVLYPGHGPTTTVAVERASNPFVRPLY